MSGVERLCIRDRIGSFAPGQELRGALILTYSFDGRWFEDNVVPEIYSRPVACGLVVSDANALVSEAPSVRYRRARVEYDTHVFHPKLVLLAAEDRALAVITSANMTRGGWERNLELGLALELRPESGPKPFFRSLYKYLAGPLRGALHGDSRAVLDDIASALADVLKQVRGTDEHCPHRLVHNFGRPIWSQLLDSLPHRVLRRALVVSPFYEGDDGGAEDPPGEALDTGLIERLFRDFSFEPPLREKPVRILFREYLGATALPLGKLRAFEKQITLLARSSAFEFGGPLHGKLLVLEGAGTAGRESYTVLLHGSPNFTPAALLHTPPQGNAELAVLTFLPAPRAALSEVVNALGLTDLFHEVANWSALRHVEFPAPESAASLGARFVADATLEIGSGTLRLALSGVPEAATRIQVFAEISGQRVLIGDSALPPDAMRVSCQAGELIQPDAVTGLKSLAAAAVWVDVLAANGSLLGSRQVPLNVDCPDQFCGLIMTDPAVASLDQRIARAGTGTTLTYREQQKFMEAQRSRIEDQALPGRGPTHQANLDTFFRNVHAGLRGLRSRVAAGRSEFTVKRTLRDLICWTREAVASEHGLPTLECQLFLVDRLAREIVTLVETVSTGHMSQLLLELKAENVIEEAQVWLKTAKSPDLSPYVRACGARLREARKQVHDKV